MSYVIQERSWQLEKRVPLTVILAVIVQLGAGLIWAAQLDARVARMEKDIEHIASALERWR